MNKLNISTLINIANKINNIDNNTIPNNKVFTIELDGSGDFTSLTEALNYLKGKSCNTKVTLQFGNGTFDIPEDTVVDGSKFNIPFLHIQGKGIDNTILSCTNSFTDYTSVIYLQYISTIIEDLTLIRPNGTKSTLPRGISTSWFSKTFLKNVKIIGCACAAACFNGGTLFMSDNISINNTVTAIFCCSTTCTSAWSTTFSFNNVGTAFYVSNGGHIFLDGNNTASTSNVTKLYSQNIGTATNNGYISSVF